MLKKTDDLLMNYSRFLKFFVMSMAILTFQSLAYSVPQCFCDILTETVQGNRTNINFNINNNNNIQNGHSNNYDSYNKIISVKSSDAALRSNGISDITTNSSTESGKQIPLVRLPSNTLLKYTAYKDVSILHFHVPADTRTAVFTFKAYEEPNSAFSKYFVSLKFFSIIRPFQI